MPRSFFVVVDGIVDLAEMERSDPARSNAGEISPNFGWNGIHECNNVSRRICERRRVFELSDQYMRCETVTTFNLDWNKWATPEEQLPELLNKMGTILRGTAGNAIAYFDDVEYTFVRLNGKVWMNPDSFVLQHVSPKWLGVEVSLETHDLPHGRWEHP